MRARIPRRGVRIAFVECGRLEDFLGHAQDGGDVWFSLVSPVPPGGSYLRFRVTLGMTVLEVILISTGFKDWFVGVEFDQPDGDCGEDHDCGGNEVGGGGGVGVSDIGGEGANNAGEGTEGLIDAKD